MPYSPFDLTKVWYHKDYPLMKSACWNSAQPENYFAEVEQSAFNPNVVPVVSHRTRCCRAVFLLRGRPALPLGVNLHQIRSTPRAAPSASTTATAPCGWTATRAADPVTTPTATRSGRTPPNCANRRWNWTDRGPLSAGRRLLHSRAALPPDERQSSRLSSTTPPRHGRRAQEIKIRHIGHCLKPIPPTAKSGQGLGHGYERDW